MSLVLYFLSMPVQGHPSLIIPTIKAKLVKTLLANYAMWPLAHIINFKFIPSSQRILYINCVQVMHKLLLLVLDPSARVQVDCLVDAFI